ncbi:hypothetical protein B0T17DRAFT_288025 [Bombardia bombarda]|uniref:Uncharacterized protein n=1 Tax=Bombardia bombarda TaxID=252184 RepID=A0AA39WTW7_9PEZI|nr:hypothetical protein B0T17DRAFT_288025 [Bombardia bombarda]
MDHHHPSSSPSRPPRQSRSSSDKHGVTSDSQSTQPWTATRCHRLLRPLLTHIAALRKEKARRSAINSNQSGPDESSLQAANKEGRLVGKNQYPKKKMRYGKTWRSASLHRQEKLPQHPQQVRRRRPGRKAREEVTLLTTPFLRRVRDCPLSSPVAKQMTSNSETYAISETLRDPFRPPSPTATATATTKCAHANNSCTKTRCTFECEVARFRTKMDDERAALYESVFRALDSLLRATCPRKSQAAAPKSLLAMCLRKVPAYVAELEYWEHHDAEQGVDGADTNLKLQGSKVAFDVYDELESFGVVDGWRHLCIALRAHGVWVIQEAVAEGDLLDDKFTCLLIRLCLEHMPVTECMGLVDSFVLRQYRPPLTMYDSFVRDDAEFEPILSLMIYISPRGSSFTVQKLRELLEKGLLPAEWVLLSDLRPIWALAVRLVTEKGPCQDVVDFIIATIKVLCRFLSTPRSRLDTGGTETVSQKVRKTLINDIAALTSIALLDQDGPPERTLSNRITTLGKRVQYIIHSCLTSLQDQQQHSKPHNGQLGIYLLNLCDFLSFRTDGSSAAIAASWSEVQGGGGGRSRGGSSRSSDDDNDGWARQYDTTMVFISSVAHYCSRGAHVPPNVYFSQICDRLEALPPLTGSPLSNMRVDGAFCLAEQTGDLRDLAFAESLKLQKEKNSSSVVRDNNDGSPSGSSSNGGDRNEKTLFAGFRWDEGISEWVLIAPDQGPDSAGTTASKQLRTGTRTTRTRVSLPQDTDMPPASSSSSSSSSSSNETRRAAAPADSDADDQEDDNDATADHSESRPLKLPSIMDPEEDFPAAATAADNQQQGAVVGGSQRQRRDGSAEVAAAIVSDVPLLPAAAAAAAEAEAEAGPEDGPLLSYRRGLRRPRSSLLLLKKKMEQQLTTETAAGDNELSVDESADDVDNSNGNDNSGARGKKRTSLLSLQPLRPRKRTSMIGSNSERISGYADGSSDDELSLL